MLKALLKKQFAELGQAFLTVKKKGKKRTVVGAVILYTLVFLLVTVAFFGVGFLLSGFFQAGVPALYFSIFAILSVLLGVFGSAFTTCAGLYLAKDNEQLLAMPIPSRMILFTRVLPVLVTGFYYLAPSWIAAVLCSFLFVTPTPVWILCQVAVFLLLGIFVCFLSCVLGFLVALISCRLKNKAIFTALLTVAFLVGYYVLYFKALNALDDLLLYTGEIQAFLASYFRLSSLFGAAASGDGKALLIATAAVIVLFALAAFVLSKTFLKISIQKVGGGSRPYEVKTEKTASPAWALVKKESKRFLGSSAYLVNTGLGILLLPACVVAFLLKRADLAVLTAEIPNLESQLPLAVLGVVFFIVSMDAMSASSISLEGNRLWILKSLPVKTYDVLLAKRNAHLLFNAPVAVLSVAILGWVQSRSVTVTLLLAVSGFLFVVFISYLGLFWNLKKPMLDWTNEMLPVKQSAAAGLSLLCGMLSGIALLVPGFFLVGSFLSPESYLTVLVLLLALLCRLLDSWLKKTGCALFEAL